MSSPSMARRFLDSRQGGALAGGVLLALLVVIVSSSVAVMSFSLTNIVTSALISLIAVLGLSAFSGNSGLLSFSQVGFMAVGAYTAGILVVPARIKATALPDLPGFLAGAETSPAVGLLVAVLAAAVVGAVTALPMARLQGAAAVIASIGVLMIIHTVIVATTSITRGSQTFYGVPRAISYQLVLALAVVAIVLVRVFKDSRVGLMLRASRDDELAAAAIGVSFGRHRFVSWVLAAALGGLAGGLYGYFLGAFSPRQFYFSLTLTLLAMLVVGGINTVTGAVVGTTVISIMTELLRRLEGGFSLGSFEVGQIFGLTDGGLAVAILVVMYLRPEGLIGSFELDEWLRSVWRRRRPTAPADAIDWDRLRVGEPTVLAAASISKAYAGVQALADVTIEMRTGQIVGLIGANGSGKSTLVNVLSGVTPPDSGSVTFAGRDITRVSSQRRARQGLARTFQSMRLFAGLTVHDNVVVAATAAGSDSGLARALATDSVGDKEYRLATTLSYGDQRRVEIARALALQPTFVLLDEPAAGMNDVESSALAESLRDTVARTGIGILIVDHDMRMMTTLCEHLVVLDHGAVIAEGPPGDVMRDPKVGALYLGSEAASHAGPPSP